MCTLRAIVWNECVAQKTSMISEYNFELDGPTVWLFTNVLENTLAAR